jgi:hypothetical protein
MSIGPNTHPSGYLGVALQSVTLRTGFEGALQDFRRNGARFGGTLSPQVRDDSLKTTMTIDLRRVRGSFGAAAGPACHFFAAANHARSRWLKLNALRSSLAAGGISASRALAPAGQPLGAGCASRPLPPLVRSRAPRTNPSRHPSAALRQHYGRRRPPVIGCR